MIIGVSILMIIVTIGFMMPIVREIHKTNKRLKELDTPPIPKFEVGDIVKCIDPSLFNNILPLPLNNIDMGYGVVFEVNPNAKCCWVVHYYVIFHDISPRPILFLQTQLEMIYSSALDAHD